MKIKYNRRIARVSNIQYAGKGSFYDFYITLIKGTESLYYEMVYHLSKVKVRTLLNNNTLIAEVIFNDMEEAKVYTSKKVNELLENGYIQE